MKIAYHYPSPFSLNAYRTIYNGYKNAFTHLDHQFLTFTADDNLSEFLDKHRPDLFMTSSHFYYRRYLDLDMLSSYRQRGMKLLTKIDFWDSPLGKVRINEAPSLRDDKEVVELIKAGKMGDAFYHTVEPDDQRMDGFTQGTGYSFHTIPLAADRHLTPKYDNRYQADISFVGSNLPQKRLFFEKYILPLGRDYNLKLYGQDWTRSDWLLGWVQRFGQYFNLPYLKSVRKPKLKIEDELNIYLSSQISINVHEEYQKKYGGECNERTFKIPYSGGFEIVDNVACIGKYFVPDKEIIIARDADDFVDKIRYYLDHPEKKQQIIDAGRQRVMASHTYDNRARQIIDILTGLR